MEWHKFTERYPDCKWIWVYVPNEINLIETEDLTYPTKWDVDQIESEGFWAIADIRYPEFPGK